MKFDSADKSLIPYGPKQKAWKEQVPDGATTTPPLENPVSVYPRTPPARIEDDFPKLDYRKFEIPPDGLNQRERMAAMAELERFIKTQHANFTGFQVNEDLDFQDLSWLLDIHANNVGDPYGDGYLTLNTKLVERSVLDYFAALWNAKWPHHDEEDNGDQENAYKERHWGYVLSMGSTEGNLYGVYNARNYLNGSQLLHEENTIGMASCFSRNKMAPLRSSAFLRPVEHFANHYTPVAFFSEDTHYSVVKAMNVMQVKTFSEVGRATGQPCPINNGDWPTEVPSHDYSADTKSGTIIVEHLERLLRFFLDRNYPPLIILNVGSTWKGAYDNVAEVNDMLIRLGAEYPWLWEREVEYKKEDGSRHVDVRRGFWLHVDGALGAAYLPFFEMAYNRELISYRGPIFDFRNEAVMSICCSMHKWIGAPWPGGVYMTKIKYQTQPPAVAGYIGSADTTLGGSRNAFSPVLLWHYLSRVNYEDSMRAVIKAEESAEYMENRLKELEDYLKKTDPSADLWIHRSKLSLAVTFRMVNPTIAYKYTVDAERLLVPLLNGEYEERTFGHIYAMQSLGNFSIVDDFITYLIGICDSSGWKTTFPESKTLTMDGLPNPGPRKHIDQ
ncbi:MAG: hypothetical protein JXR76_29635 [Deltaproteobacteria bacterium]|nr:hypothetical protein [Deltaproteobacteria bacterium]